MVEHLERFRWLIVAILGLPLVASVAFLVDHQLKDPEPPIVQDAGTSYYDIRVYVAGAVANPGIYAMEDGSRWGDAIAVAGGFTSEANHEVVNLARRVQDEDHIVVPRVNAGVPGEIAPGDLVNINSASELELIALPGIGEARAADIVRSRTQDGPFAVPEDLVVRELLPDSVFQDIVSLITVSQ
jgi:competence protein ComEA